MAALQPPTGNNERVWRRPPRIVLTRASQQAEDNAAYRQVLDTTQQMQLVMMSVDPLDLVPSEVHKYSSQFVRVVAGEGEADVDGFRFGLRPGYTFIVPANARHELRNTSADDALKLLVVYAPPLHEPDERVAFRGDDDDS
jgi:mannose-6-phosphate isomerase-like protein (cupin superfamily)